MEQLIIAPPPHGSFGALLRAYRHRAYLSQEQLAARAEVSERTVPNLEAGRVCSPRTDTVQLLADALQLDEPERRNWFGGRPGRESPAGGARGARGERPGAAARRCPRPAAAECVRLRPGEQSPARPFTRYGVPGRDRCAVPARKRADRSGSKGCQFG